MSGLSLDDLPDEAGESEPAPRRPILIPDAGVGVKWFIARIQKLLDEGKIR